MFSKEEGIQNFDSHKEFKEYKDYIFSTCLKGVNIQTILGYDAFDKRFVPFVGCGMLTYIYING